MNTVKSLIITLVAWAIVFVGFYYLLPYDETDNRESRERSGASLVIDHGTGCHYLSKIFGGITPRLDKNGNQICR